MWTGIACLICRPQYQICRGATCRAQKAGSLWDPALQHYRHNYKSGGPPFMVGLLFIFNPIFIILNSKLTPRGEPPFPMLSLHLFEFGIYDIVVFSGFRFSRLIAIAIFRLSLLIHFSRSGLPGLVHCFGCRSHFIKVLGF